MSFLKCRSHMSATAGRVGILLHTTLHSASHTLLKDRIEAISSPMSTPSVEREPSSNVTDGNKSSSQELACSDGESGQFRSQFQSNLASHNPLSKKCNTSNWSSSEISGNAHNLGIPNQTDLIDDPNSVKTSEAITPSRDSNPSTRSSTPLSKYQEPYHKQHLLQHPHIIGENPTETNIQRFPEQNFVVRLIEKDEGGLYSIPGKKHQRDSKLNEDVGAIGNYEVMDRSDTHSRKNYNVRIAWIFDGHGPPSLNRIRSPGGLMSKTAFKAHQLSIAANLGKIIVAPVLSPKHSKYLIASRQSHFSVTFNTTQSVVENFLPPIVTQFAGTTSTAVLSIEDKSSGHIDVLCGNLGDSRAIALTFRKDVLSPQLQHRTPSPYLLSPDSIYTLTAEENIRLAAEKQWFIQACLESGLYRPAAIHSRALSFKHPLMVVMVPTRKVKNFNIRDFEPFSCLEDIQAALSCARQALPENDEYSVYALKHPYIWRLDAFGKGKINGLQITGSIGDSHLNFVKRKWRNANDVSVIGLSPDVKKSTLVIAASDGLWDAVEKLPLKLSSLATFIADRLNIYRGSTSTNQTLAKDLAKWAATSENDDVTIAILDYPNMAVESALYGEGHQPTGTELLQKPQTMFSKYLPSVMKRNV